jgi:Domain of unknown function DUF29
MALDTAWGVSVLPALPGGRREAMTKTSYDTDLYAWTQTQAKALRTKRWEALDLEHLAEEIESLGIKQRHAVDTHLRILLLHLLKWIHQPMESWTSWQCSIDARDELNWRLTRNPSLRLKLPVSVAWAYPRARQLAARETGLPLATFPESCPWSLEQLLDEDFWPEETPAC